MQRVCFTLFITIFVRVCSVHSNTINTVAELDHERGNVNFYEDPVVYVRFKTKK